MSASLVLPLVRRIKELEADYQIRNGQSEEVSKWLLWDDAKDFIRENCREIVFNNKDFEELTDPEKFPYRTADELRPFIQELNEVKTDFIHILEVILNDEWHPDDFDDFDHFYRTTTFAYSDRRFYYEIIFTLFTVEPSTISYTIDAASINRNEYRAKRTDSDRLLGELKNILYQIEAQKNNLKAYGKPDGLWLGLLVIVYACVVGVIWPITLQPYPLEVYNDVLTKWVLLGWFISALLAIFAYLAWSTYRLTVRK
ncbi:hypothetical protein BK120_22760 [Paenibacillus sp. FSL A5-0031]|uniref:hypothetical protein n=1 Tax=Paenibacillus sp. FSL A5-0031 TaxID=1920420 RepID=UPI00096E57BA|nr:hypothetical protein [Paenibacillus sp. FSL A5-0031]OME78565.1 hypothetical protein BK120_22760 [Paenibacillus sp. FSL A5-0031]